MYKQRVDHPDGSHAGADFFNVLMLSDIRMRNVSQPVAPCEVLLIERGCASMSCMWPTCLIPCVEYGAKFAVARLERYDLEMHLHRYRSCTELHDICPGACDIHVVYAQTATGMDLIQLQRPSPRLTPQQAEQHPVEAALRVVEG